MFKKRREHESPRIYHELTINYSGVAKLILRIAYSLETYPLAKQPIPLAEGFDARDRSQGYTR